jgi:vacuolar-type H+-ATPase subunit I/STV1
MARRTTTIDLSEEVQRLDQRLDDLAEETAQVETRLDELEDDDRTDSAAYQQAEDEYQDLREEAAQLERYLVGATAALNPDDAEREPVEEVTVGEVLTGDFAEIEDRARDVQRQRVGRGDDSSVSGAERVFFVAAGLVDAPFLEDDSFEARAQAVSELRPQFTAWLEDQIDDLSTPDVDVGNFEDRVEQTK